MACTSRWSSAVSICSTTERKTGENIGTLIENRSVLGGAVTQVCEASRWGRVIAAQVLDEDRETHATAPVIDQRGSACQHGTAQNDAAVTETPHNWLRRIGVRGQADR